MKKIFLITTIILISFSVFADRNEQQKIIQEANELYKNEKYQEAIFTYKKVIDNGYEAAELYYNIGNAYFKINKLGYAILYYEKAKLLAPNNKKNNQNLKFAQSFINNDIKNIPEFFVKKAVMQIIISKSSNFWAFLSIFLFIFGITFLILFLFFKKNQFKKLVFFIAILLLITSGSFVVFSYKMKKFSSENKQAIVVKNATMNSSPEFDSEDLYILPEGIKVSILNKSDDWYEIKLSNGKIGWLTTENIEKI